MKSRTSAIQSDSAKRHKWKNWLDSAILLLGMGALLSLVGYLLLGATGLFLGAALWLVSSLFSPRLSPWLLQRMFQAVPVERYEAPGLYSLVDELSQRAELSVTPQLLYVPTPMVNAFAVGSKEQPFLGVTDGLLRTLEQHELEGVLAHEVAHIKNNDLWLMGLADRMSRLTSILSMGGLFLLFLSLPVILFSSQTMPWLLVMLLLVAPTLNRLMQLALSRTREFDADLEAALLTGNPRGMARTLQKIEYHSKPWWQRLFWPMAQAEQQSSLLRSHPPTSERVQRLLEVAEKEEYRWERRNPVRRVVVLPRGWNRPRPRVRRVQLWL